MTVIKSLALQDFNFAYKPESPLFLGVNFEFPQSAYVVVRGHAPGSGCSTLFQILLGLIEGQTGKYLINNKPLSQMSFDQFLPYRLKLGYSFDQGGLLHNRTLLENLTLPLVYHKVSSFREAQNHALEYINRLGFAQSANLRPSHVQGSLRKMTVLIRSLILSPQILFLDEPTHGLPMAITRSFLNLL